MTTTEKIQKARTGLVLDQPFFGSLVLRMKMIEDKSIETACINGKEIKYNPEFVDGLSNDQLKGLLAHEVMHVALLHHTRRDNRDKKLWNRACDYAINILLYDAKFYLPDNGLLDHRYKGWSSEQIYSELQQQKSQPKPDPQPQQGEGEGSGGEGDDVENDGASDGASDDEGVSEGVNEGEEKEDEGTGWGDVEDAVDDDGNPAMGADLAQAEQDAKIMTQQAALEARMQGNITGGIDRSVNQIMQPQVNWRDVLNRFVNEFAKNDYTWNVPNRRFIADGLYLPSMRSEEIGNIVLAVDTSGSMDEQALNQCAGELSDILGVLNSSMLTVIYADSKVQSVEEFTQQDLPIKPNPVGGGGTDFRPVFKYIKDNNIDPVCMIYLTDMDGAFPDKEPEYPVLWGVTNARWWNKRVPFGEYVIVSE